jgi:hypothetical protein
MSFWKQYPNLQFDEATHTYRWNGRCVPSVTQLFDRVGIRNDDKSPWKPLGCPDFAKHDHDKIFGHAFHKMANGIALGMHVSIPEEMSRWKEKVEEFLSENVITPIYDNAGNPLSEYPMYSNVYGFCGTPDHFGRELKSGCLWLVDWKSSPHYMKSYSWQTAGYEIAVRETFGNKLFDLKEKIIRLTVLVDGSDKKAEVVFRKNNPEDKIAFQSILNTYKLAA